MKRFIEGEDRSQVTLLPECLMITSGKTIQFVSSMRSLKNSSCETWASRVLNRL